MCEIMNWESSCSWIPTLWPSSQGAGEPTTPTSAHLLSLGAWQASVTLGALSGAGAGSGEGAATGLACPSEGKGGGRG